MDYRSSGVDIEAGYRSVELIKDVVASTKRSEVIGGLGGFAGAFSMSGYKDMEEPVLVSGTDGCGTKVKLAFIMDKHDTIGIDAVAMCVNDIVCGGAEPLFFLDYIACGKNHPEKIAKIVEGVAEGCRQAGCSLVGGETAEHPGLMPEDEYDLAGFAVGIVDRKKIIDGSSLCEGDILLGLASTGVHSNGFSLVRKVFGIDKKEVLDEKLPDGRTLGETLLTPTKLYVKPVLDLIKRSDVRAISHITGGGFYENIPRAIPGGLCAKINLSTIRTPAIFDLIMKTGGISRDEMYHVFNMGVGMVLISDRADEILRAVEGSYLIGEIVKGEGGIELC